MPRLCDSCPGHCLCPWGVYSPSRIPFIAAIALGPSSSLSLGLREARRCPVDLARCLQLSDCRPVQVAGFWGIWIAASLTRRITMDARMPSQTCQATTGLCSRPLVVVTRSAQAPPWED